MWMCLLNVHKHTYACTLYTCTYYYHHRYTNVRARRDSDTRTFSNRWFVYVNVPTYWKQQCRNEHRNVYVFRKKKLPKIKEWKVQQIGAMSIQVQKHCSDMESDYFILKTMHRNYFPHREHAERSCYSIIPPFLSHNSSHYSVYPAKNVGFHLRILKWLAFSDKHMYKVNKYKTSDNDAILNVLMKFKWLLFILPFSNNRGRYVISLSVWWIDRPRES